MQLSFEDSSGVATFVLTHGDQVLEWDAKEYSGVGKTKILDDINGYWATLSPKRQADIWQIYTAIHKVLNDVNNIALLRREVCRLTKALYEQQPFAEIEYWCNLKANVVVPPTFKVEYAPEDLPYKQRTYLAEDYRGLMHLAVWLRPMLPIWAEYLVKIKPHFDGQGREKFVMAALSQSAVVKSKPLLRLQEYIEASVTTESTTMASLLGTLGSDELPEWLLGLGVVRRVAVGEVGITTDGSTIISNVYNFLFSSTLRTIDRRFGGRVKDKTPQGGADDDKASIIENYKMKQEVSDGDLVANDVASRRVLDLTLQLDPTVPVEWVTLCHSNLLAIPSFDPTQHQMTLAQWVNSTVTSARGLPTAQYSTVVGQIAMAQAHLLHRGWIELGLLMSAVPVVASKTSLVGGGEERPRLDRETTEELLKRFKYFQRPMGSKGGTERQQNPAIKAIDKLTMEMIRHRWTVYLPETLSAHLDLGRLLLKTSRTTTGTVQSLGVLTVGGDIRHQLATLIIDINTRRNKS